MRATHTRSRSASGWDKSKPKTRGARRALLARCGARAFLVPSGSPAPKYPIVAKGSTSCAPDCRALRAAATRAKIQKRTSIAAKAHRIARAAGCDWSR